MTRYSEVAPSRLLSQSCGRRENERSIVKDKLALVSATYLASASRSIAEA